MQRYLELSTSRDETLERKAIAGVLAIRSVPAGFRPEMCVGPNRKLAQVLVEQWERHHEVNTDMVPDEHLGALTLALQTSPDCGEIVLSQLIAHEARRNIGDSVIHADTAEDPLMLAANLQGKMSAILLGSSREEKYDHHREVMRLIDTLQTASKAGKEIAGASIGIPDFDSVTNGIELGKLYLLGALKKTGKSRFMIHCAATLSQAGHGVLINSLEMNRTQLLSCALGWCGDLNTSLLGSTMPMREYQKMGMGMGPLHEMKWHISKEKTVPELRARIHDASSKMDIEYVFVDFLQRMRASRGAKDRVREVEEIAVDLADLSRDMNVGVIALCQLSGEAERLDEDEIPNMQHIKESQAAAENADTIITMHNPDRKKTEFFGGEYHAQTIMFRIEQRYGISGKVVKALGDLRTCRFAPDAGEAGEGLDGFSEPGPGVGAPRNARRPYVD